ncbi:hypothetical protein I204_08513 [Kwoniella mangroviensis CBS 8886]|uniref:uncharacterized protein n=1 Tax=Kwoniella mangroviensis CBS 8507 TaxID=1296122 RepID=UPI00080D0156|nr:uncharacterized protein I203_08311 [Kwoniella mangroviensis CBS 8507]OCF62628.1 hypothetical protein I203_08311 [Kwoniella mangroviensis CBS 8507]OCF70823.1 hypothetical protein I204_08513 [Kwoniella mangroviensis CBS 8886]
MSSYQTCSNYSRGNSSHIVYPLTPPQTPVSQAYQSPTTTPVKHENTKYDGDSVPSPLSSAIPDFDLNSIPEEIPDDERAQDEISDRYIWRKGMSEAEKDEREAWLCEKRDRKGLRIVIVTENFLPKVDGVTRTLSRLLEHLQSQGHECILLGPASTLSSYASHPLVGTLGIPLVVYPGLKLNFLRPKFLSIIRDWEPDVVHFVDPIWLGAQTILAMELGWAGDKWLSQESDSPTMGKGLGGAVVASYHTNLATYATLFGLSFLTPIIWAFQSSLYSKLLLTLCPSPSTKSMLESQSFNGVRLWPRGVDLSQFGPHKRDEALRASWGISIPENKEKMLLEDTKYVLEKQGMMTPPLTPWNGPINGASIPHGVDEDEVVLLYVGRISWEKNLQLILSAYSLLAQFLPEGSLLPKLVFVGDGPARSDLEARCSAEKNWDVTFMGHRQGEELAKCYASADIFVFPSFTETFGQVVLEALASGLPVVGLDAEGTRDLVTHDQTGLLLSLPTKETTWPHACKSDSPYFQELSSSYAEMISTLVMDGKRRREIGRRGSTEGIKGYTWWDAMEACVDGYRESMRISRSRRNLQVIPHSPPEEIATIPCPVPKSRRGLSLVNRVVSRRLAYKEPRSPIKGGRGRVRWMLSKKDEGGWLSMRTLVKIIMTLCLFYALWRHHISQITSDSLLEAGKSRP